MAMQAESLEILEGAALPPSQARAIVRAIEIEIAGAKDVLATKHDIVLLRAEIKDTAGQLRTEMHAMGGHLRAEMHAMCGQLRAEMHEIAGKLRGEIQASASGIVRQMYTAMLGQMAVLLGLAYFFVTHLNG